VTLKALRKSVIKEDSVLATQKFTTYIMAVVWFLKRPQLCPQLFRMIKATISNMFHPSDTRQEAESWCRQQAVSTAEAIEQITGSAMVQTVREKFKDVFAKAEEARRACPVTMGGAGDLDLLYWIAEYLQAKSVIETGVAYGWSSLALLLSLVNRGDNTLLISTDMPYINRNKDRYVGCVVPAEFKSHWRIISLADREALPKALKTLERIDMCHYDSDKSYSGRMWAYPRLWQALKPGGCFISDDIGDNVAFRDLCSQVNAGPIVVALAKTNNKTKYAGILIKKGLD